jgi:hypothetical protein
MVASTPTKICLLEDTTVGFGVAPSFVGQYVLLYMYDVCVCAYIYIHIYYIYRYIYYTYIHVYILTALFFQRGRMPC